MIQLKELIRAIQNGAMEAAQTVVDKNIDLFEFYFEKVTDADDATDMFHAAVSAGSDVSSADSKATADMIKKAAEAVTAAASALKGAGAGEERGAEGRA